MPKNDDVIAVVCADIHLCENPPVARAAEKSWWDAMARPLDEIGGLADKYDCPILVAGDLFDKWNPHPPLLNFALEHLPENIWAIPGNHDTPYHSLNLIGQSAYWTMVAAGKIHDLERIQNFDNFFVDAYPFGSAVCASSGKHQSENRPLIALIHAYCYHGPATTYPNSPQSGNLKTFPLSGYDAAFFGDNHIFFTDRVKKTNVMNCGCLLRRTAAEKNYAPHCGLLLHDGTIKPHQLDVTADRWIDGADKLAEAEIATGIDLSGFADELSNLADEGLDFRDALRRRCEESKLNRDITKIVLKAAGL